MIFLHQAQYHHGKNEHGQFDFHKLLIQQINNITCAPSNCGPCSQSNLSTIFCNGFAMIKNDRNYHALNALPTINWQQDEAALAKTALGPWPLSMCCHLSTMITISFIFKKIYPRDFASWLIVRSVVSTG